jgi:hypothetical protein
MAITRVREGVNATNTANVTVTLAGAPSSGNLLVAIVASGAAMTAAGIWNKLTTVTDADQGALFWKIAAGGEVAAQIPCTTTTNWSCVLAEYSTTNGWNASQPEVTTQNVDADATKTTTGSCDPTDGVERLVIGGMWSDGNSTFSTPLVNGSGTSVNEVQDTAQGTAAGGNTAMMLERLDASTVSGNYTAQALCARTDNGGAHIAIFQPIAGGGGAPPPRQRPALLGVS